MPVIRHYNTMVIFVTVERHWVIAVQYGSILRHDGLFPAPTKKQTSKFDINLSTFCMKVYRYNRKISAEYACRFLLPVTPRPQYGTNKDKQEDHVRYPHDDSHGIHAEDSPRNRGRGRYRFRATGICAVLTGAGTRPVLQALSTVESLVGHGSETCHRIV